MKCINEPSNNVWSLVVVKIQAKQCMFWNFDRWAKNTQSANSLVLIMTVYYLTFNTVPCLELTGSRIAACNTGWTPIAPGYKTHHWGTLLSPSWWAWYDASTASRLEMRHAKQLRPRYESADEIFDASTWNFFEFFFFNWKGGCSC